MHEVISHLTGDLDVRVSSLLHELRDGLLEPTSRSHHGEILATTLVGGSLCNVHNGSSITRAASDLS